MCLMLGGEWNLSAFFIVVAFFLFWRFRYQQQQLQYRHTDVEGITDPEKDKVLGCPHATFRFHRLEILILKHELSVGETRFGRDSESIELLHNGRGKVVAICCC